MYRKNWTSLLVSLYVDGTDLSILSEREEAFDTIKAALLSLPTFTLDLQPVETGNGRSARHLVGTVDYRMEPDELKTLVSNSTEYPLDLMRIVQW